MSDDIAFGILSSRRWRPEDLRSATQRELRRENRVQNFLREHREKMRDPMTLDIAGWNESLVKGNGWPFCSKCKSIVKGYCEEHDSSKYTAIRAWCHGDGSIERGGQVIEIAKPSPDIRERDPGWLRRVIRSLVFYAA